MTHDVNRSLARAAALGLVLGASACAEGGSAPAKSPSQASGAPAPEAAEGKDCCKGQNACKGKGNCAAQGKHECAGMNECKGQGGCNGHCPKQ
ncbi:MAG TPA: hypothetical protein VF989_08870 [Polyangiaceae bacterium]|jgi:hypothetical protein